MNKLPVIGVVVILIPLVQGSWRVVRFVSRTDADGLVRTIVLRTDDIVEHTPEIAGGIAKGGRVARKHGDDVFEEVAEADRTVPEKGKFFAAGAAASVAKADLDTAPVVIKTVQRSDGLVDAVIKKAQEQFVEVTVDCAIGVITPTEAVRPESILNLVQTICSQVATVPPNYSKPQSANDGNIRAVKAERYANLHSTPRSDSPVISMIANGARVKVVGHAVDPLGQEWSYIEVGEQRGWIVSKLLDWGDSASQNGIP